VGSLYSSYPSFRPSSQRAINQVNLPRQLKYCLLLLGLPLIGYSQGIDSLRVLKKVTVNAVKKKNTFSAITPEQSLSRETLQEINANSIGDAAKYFSGVLIKDYGGVGGLKTISVRGLGASQTGILYDGIPVSDEQTGQIDLSKYSPTFIEKLDLHLAGMPGTLTPARTYSGASLLEMTSSSFDATYIHEQRWMGGLKAGSFGFWQPFAAASLPFKKNLLLTINAEATVSKGNYPYTVNNGVFSVRLNRENSEVGSIQCEANLLKLFSDSSTLQLKTGLYNSKRGLPGAIIFFNDRSVQKLWDADYFLQERYKRKLSKNTELLASAKYSNDYTRYTDPDYLNNQGGLDNQYQQQEFYFSAAVSHLVQPHLTLTLASDAAFGNMIANLTGFAYPFRESYWNSIAGQYHQKLWQLNGSLLLTDIFDQTKSGLAAGKKEKLTPALALSAWPMENSPFLFRAFYKDIFRMPTFDDLYYNFVGNTILRPEYSSQYDLGITYSKRFNQTLRQFSIGIDAYYNQVKDKIVAVPNKNLFVWTMLNIGKVQIKGIDVTSEIQLLLFNRIKWFTRIAYTWQQALDVTDPASNTYKNRIPYTPDNSGSGLTTFDYRGWLTGYSLIFSGIRYALGENNVYNELDGWMTQDFFISRQLRFNKVHINIKAEVDNLSNQFYDVVRYFPMPGRSFKMSVFFNNL
jgi:vitamin B12 transporter